MISKLFIGLLHPQECPASAALIPQNFGVLTSDTTLLDELHGVAVVQGITKVEVLPFILASGMTWQFSRLYTPGRGAAPGPGPGPL